MQIMWGCAYGLWALRGMGKSVSTALMGAMFKSYLVSICEG